MYKDTVLKRPVLPSSGPSSYYMTILLPSGNNACIQYTYKCPQLDTECCWIPQQQAVSFNGQRIKFDVQVSPTELCYSKHDYYFKNSHQYLVSPTAFPQAVQYVHSRSTRQASKKLHISAPSQTEEKSVITRNFHTTSYITFNIPLV